MAELGIGTYRIVDTNQAHIDALITAFRNGITLVDTAVDFTDGAAHRAVAKAIETIPNKDDIKIISKFGFIQGRVLQLLGEDKELFDVVSEKMIQISKDRFYSLAKEFVHHQLRLTLDELQQEQIECFMINSLEKLYEHYLQEFSKKEALENLYDDLFDAFVALEEEVKAKRINSYGISSMSFSLKEEDELFIPYEKLVEIATEAAFYTKQEQHHFGMIELPINIVQKEALFVTFWAKEQNIKVIANQPLQAFYQDNYFRLVEGEENRDYYIYLNELLDFCDNELLEPLFNLINELDERVHRYENITQYDSFVHTEVLPHIKQTLLKLDEQNKEKLIHMLDLFLTAYREMVGYECGKKTKQSLARYMQGCERTLQSCALEYLLKQESIDYVVVGARRVKYVYELLELKEKFISS